MIVALLLAVVSMSASAQFTKGTKYANATLSGMGMSYDTGRKFCFGLGVTGGYFFADSWMAKAQFDYGHEGGSPGINKLKIGAGARYYFTQNGIFMGAGLQFEHRGGDNNFVQLPVEVGYCYYLNQYISIEPALFADLCLNKFNQATNVGLKISVGYYF